MKQEERFEPLLSEARQDTQRAIRYIQELSDKITAFQRDKALMASLATHSEGNPAPNAG